MVLVGDEAPMIGKRVKSLSGRARFKSRRDMALAAVVICPILAACDSASVSLRVSLPENICPAERVTVVGIVENARSFRYTENGAVVQQRPSSTRFSDRVDRELFPTVDTTFRLGASSDSTFGADTANAVCRGRASCLSAVGGVIYDSEATELRNVVLEDEATTVRFNRDQCSDGVVRYRAAEAAGTWSDRVHVVGATLLPTPRITSAFVSHADRDRSASAEIPVGEERTEFAGMLVPGYWTLLPTLTPEAHQACAAPPQRCPASYVCPEDYNPNRPPEYILLSVRLTCR